MTRPRLIFVYEGLPTTIHQTYQIRLAGDPGGTVTVKPVPVTPGDETRITTSGPLTFNSQNWARPQNIVLRGEWDEDGDNERGYIDHIVTGYDAPSLKVQVIVRDYHGRTLNIQPRELNLVIGEVSSYKVKLRTDPTLYPSLKTNARVTVSPSTGDKSVATVTESPLTFDGENWSVDQEVTVTATSSDITGTESTTVTHTVTGYRGYSSTYKGEFYNPELAGRTISSVAVNVRNPDPGFEVLRIDSTVSEASGPTNADSYNIRLASVPDANVTVTLFSDNSTIATVNPRIMNFTPSNARTSQFATIRGVDDHIVNSPDRSTNIRFIASGGNYNGISLSLPVTVVDDDVRGLTFTPDAVTVAEAGGTATYTVALDTQPTAAVSVALASGDLGAATVRPASLDFTTGNWSDGQTVTVTGVDDDIDNGSGRSTTIGHTASGGDYGSVTGDVGVTVTDDDGTPTVSLALSSQLDQRERRGRPR